MKRAAVLAFLAAAYVVVRGIRRIYTPRHFPDQRFEHRTGAAWYRDAVWQKAP